MPIKNFLPFRPPALVVVAILALPLARAVELSGVSIHGAFSETAAYSDRYNYLGDTARRVSLVNDELTLNATYRWENGLRLGAQIYAYKVDGYRDLTLDFLSLDYSFNPEIGVRVGRIKEAWGFYGESQDVDMIRPFAFLPLAQYAKDLRPLNATLDGASLYGTLRAGELGSFTYQLFGGRATPAKADQPAVQNIIGATTPIQITHFEAPHKVLGVWLAWNTPLTGLRLGAAYDRVTDIVLRGTVKNTAQLALAPSDLRFAAPVLGPIFGGQPGEITLDNDQPAVFAEYTRGRWQFVTEGFLIRKALHLNLPFAHETQILKAQHYYLLSTYQATDRVQLGAYYELHYADADDHAGDKLHAVPKHLAWTKDFALAVSYNVTPWWLVKIEGHAINGTSNVAPGINGDAARWQANWGYYAVKTTLSF